MSSSSADLPSAAATGRDTGFTLLELVLAITLFAFIIVNVLADREKSIGMSADARVIQTVRYLAAAKMDEVLNDPEEYDEGDNGTFDDLDDEAESQDFTAYSWELVIEEVVVVGDRGSAEAEYLYPDDDDEVYTTNDEGETATPRTVRKVSLTVRYEPDGEFRPDLSIKVETFIPPEEDEEEGGP